MKELEDEVKQVELQGIDIVTSSGNSYHITLPPQTFTMSMIDGKA